MKTKVLIGVIAVIAVILYIEHRDRGTPSQAVAQIRQPKAADQQKASAKEEKKITLSLSLKPTFAP